MNMKKWNKLPEKVKDIMNGLSREHSLWTGEYIDRHVKESTAWAKKKYREEVITLSDSEYALWHKKVEPIKDEWLKKTSARGLPADAFLKALMTLKDKYEKEFVSE
jgi:TRAP-type C4-dicarboxylate transport system substrate-binding protein